MVIQERSGIGLLCIDFSWFCKGVIRSEFFVHSGVVKPRRVVCSWGCQDQHSWCVCVVPKEVCFFKGSRSLLWWCVYVIWIWLPNGFPSGFWKTGCSSWLNKKWSWKKWSCSSWLNKKYSAQLLYSKNSITEWCSGKEE